MSLISPSPRPHTLHTGQGPVVPIAAVWAAHELTFLTAATLLETRYGLIEAAGWAHRHADLFPVVARGCQVSTAIADAPTVTALERIGVDLDRHGHVDDLLGYVRATATIADLFAATLTAQSPCIGGPAMIGLDVVTRDAMSFDRLLQLAGAELVEAELVGVGP